jgi:hypothetical protein
VCSEMRLRPLPDSTVTCNGHGNVDGGHCCWIDGKVCVFYADGCSIWDDIGGEAWQNAPVGARFARVNPGFTCKDWPQNIPEVMAEGIGLCCWRDNGDMG